MNDDYLALDLNKHRSSYAQFSAGKIKKQLKVTLKRISVEWGYPILGNAAQTND